MKVIVEKEAKAKPVKVLVFVVMDNGMVYQSVLSDLIRFEMGTAAGVREIPWDGVKSYVERELTGVVTDSFTIVGTRPAGNGGWV
jgi:hypothetical protein